MKDLIFIFLIISFCAVSKGQLNKSRYHNKYIDTTSIKNLNTDFSLYYHTGVKPGLNFSIEYPLSRKVLEKQKRSIFSLFGMSNTKKRYKIIRKQNIIQGNISSYWHPKNHTGMLLNIQFVRRRISQRGGNIEVGTGLGILRTFLPETYEFKEDGINKVFLPGRTFITRNYSLSYGKPIFFLTQRPFVFFVRPSVYILYPYNHMFNISYAVEWGIRINFLKNPYEKSRYNY